MGKMFGGHKVVSFNDLLDVIAMDANGNAHDHVLWSFGDFAIDSQKIGSLHCLETEIVVVEVLVIDDGRVEFFGMSHDSFVSLFRNHRTWFVVLGIDIGVEVMDYLGELLLGLLVQIRHGNTDCQRQGVGDITVRRGWRSRDVWWSCRRLSRRQGCRVRLSLLPDILTMDARRRAGHVPGRHPR